MRQVYYILLTLLTSLSGLEAQSWSARQQQFIDEAVVEHGKTTATVTANDPRPLLQAVTAVREEYGWIVDYEDPPYSSKLDLVDSTDPTWRASHQAEPGVVTPAGGFFQSTYPEASDMKAANNEEAALEKIISDYNASGNPGRFALVREAEGRYAVVGIAVRNDRGQNQMVTSVLETPISLETAPRTGLATVDAIVKALSLAAGVKGGLFWDDRSLRFMQATVGGQNVSARNLLLQTFASPGSQTGLVFEWLYDPTRKEYHMNVNTATRTVRNAAGQKHKVSLEK